MAPAWGEITSTFAASVRSVGTAVTMAGVGVYLHRGGHIAKDGKRTLAKISQQVTFPLFLFSKIIYCNQDWSHSPCPDVTRSLGDVWILLFWPLYVVGVGLTIGYAVTRITKTPDRQVRSVLAACGFGNSTGLPITLLTVVHDNFPATSDLGRIDPTLFLSVYLLLYPVLQWGLGGWLLAPDDSPETTVEMPIEEDHQMLVPTPKTPRTPSLRHNVLNNRAQQSFYHQRRGNLESADEGLYMTEMDLPRLLAQEQEREERAALEVLSESLRSSTSDYGATADRNDSPTDVVTDAAFDSSTKESVPPPPPIQSVDSFDTDSLWQTIQNILERCFQPPVVGAILGLLVAVTPVRGIFVDLVDRDNSAPLQWLFDGLYAVGQAAVPINMIILGCNLSASQMKPKDQTPAVSSSMLSPQTMSGLVIGKMIVMPCVGILTGWILKEFFWDIPDDIDSSFYLVLMIVFLTPTANNVMVMVELSGSGAKEDIAQAIALQYAVAPVILSLSMTVAIGVASDWS